MTLLKQKHWLGGFSISLQAVFCEAKAPNDSHWVQVCQPREPVSLLQPSHRLTFMAWECILGMVGPLPLSYTWVICLEPKCNTSLTLGYISRHAASILDQSGTSNPTGHPERISLEERENHSQIIPPAHANLHGSLSKLKTRDRPLKPCLTAVSKKQADSGLCHSRLGEEPWWETPALSTAKLQAVYCVPYVLLPVQPKSRWQNISFM